MKLLHTSDWHIGHSLFNYDRADEHRAFFAQLGDIVAAEKPDVMVVSGDVFHYSTPSASALRLFTDGLLGVCHRCPSMRVFVTAGNHDSPSRLETSQLLWQQAGVEVIGLLRADDLESHIFKVEGVGFVVAVPYFPIGIYNVADVFGKLSAMVSERNAEALPVVCMAHAAVESADITGHDDGIGGMDYVPLSAFALGVFDYLALGHIHCPQTIKGSAGRARYCGTPLPISFDETYPHSVDIVELERGAEPLVRNLRIDAHFKVMSLPKQHVPLAQALEALEALPDDAECYVRLMVEVEKGLPVDAMERAAKIAEGKKCRLCYIDVVRAASAEQKARKEFTVSEFAKMTPLEVINHAFRERYNADLSSHQRELIGGIIDSLRE